MGLINNLVYGLIHQHQENKRQDVLNRANMYNTFLMAPDEQLAGMGYDPATARPWFAKQAQDLFEKEGGPDAKKHSGALFGALTAISPIAGGIAMLVHGLQNRHKAAAGAGVPASSSQLTGQPGDWAGEYGPAMNPAPSASPAPGQQPQPMQQPLIRPQALARPQMLSPDRIQAVRERIAQQNARLAQITEQAKHDQLVKEHNDTVNSELLRWDQATQTPNSPQESRGYGFSATPHISATPEQRTAGEMQLGFGLNLPPRSIGATEDVYFDTPEGPKQLTRLSTDPIGIYRTPEGQPTKAQPSWKFSIKPSSTTGTEHTAFWTDATTGGPKEGFYNNKTKKIESLTGDLVDLKTIKEGSLTLRDPQISEGSIGHAYKTLNDPKAPEWEKQAARLTIKKAEGFQLPPELASYLSRMAYTGGMSILGPLGFSPQLRGPILSGIAKIAGEKGTTPEQLVEQWATQGANYKALDALNKNAEFTQTFSDFVVEQLDLVDRLADELGLLTNTKFMNKAIKFLEADLKGDEKYVPYLNAVNTARQELGRILSSAMSQGQIHEGLRKDLEQFMSGDLGPRTMHEVNKVSRIEVSNRIQAQRTGVNRIVKNIGAGGVMRDVPTPQTGAGAGPNAPQVALPKPDRPGQLAPQSVWNAYVAAAKKELGSTATTQAIEQHASQMMHDAKWQ